MAGRVRVRGDVMDKPGRAVPQSVPVVLSGVPLPYVSRGGLKLEAALRHFEVSVEGLTLLDVGASTGGFTDCLLSFGASKIIAVDVGYGQLDWRLRNDPRVEVLERANIRYLTPKDMKGPVHGAVIDVSFISLKHVIPPVSGLIVDHAFIIALIKPQFEVGKGLVGKGGVVRDPHLHQQVLEDLTAFLRDSGWKIHGSLPSPILGPKGNREFLVYVSR